MKVQYCSDLHLEFSENREFINKNPLIPVGEILLLAGDILPFALLNKPCDFFDYVSDNFKTTYWIPGNHEYYNYDYKKVAPPLNEKIRENVFLLNDQQIKINDVNFIFSTLWSHISERNMRNIEQSVSDFFVIKYNGSILSAIEFNEMHQSSLSFLSKTLSETKNEKKVVVTHHVPTKMNYPEQYRTSSINEAFVTELFDFITDSKANYWLYGHHHSNIPQFTIGETEMLTNQLGYVKYNEHRLFQRNVCFEI